MLILVRRSPLQPPAMRFESQDFPRSPGGSGQWVPSSFVPGAAASGQVPPHLKRHRTEPDRPTSYLPGVRSFTPLALSMPFVNVGSSPSPAGRAVTPEGTPQRPGIPSMPSSDLLPVPDETARDQEDPFYSSEDLHAELSNDGDGATTSYASSTDAKAYSHPMKSKYNPRYLSYSQTYQYPSNQAQPSAPFFGTAGNEAAAYRASGKHRLSSHLRNRSSGTVMTSSSSNATTRIRPVFLNDSPSSSIGASSLRYQPSEPYLEDFGSNTNTENSGSSEGGSAKNRSKASSSKATKARHRLSASQPVQSSSSSTPYSSDPPDPGQVSDQSITSLAKGFVFPAPPTMQRHSKAPEVVTRREVLKSVPSGRRISGKLPDSWFGGVPEQAGPAMPGKGKARMASQFGIVGNFEDEDQDDASLSSASTDRQDRENRVEQEQREVARPESDLLAISSAQKQKASLVQQPSFTSVASTGDVSSNSHYGHAM